jgi:hypothetical protein
MDVFPLSCPPTFLSFPEITGSYLRWVLVGRKAFILK